MAIQATRVLQHQTRIPNANASTSSTSTTTSSSTNDSVANATVQIKHPAHHVHHLHQDHQNGIEQDPWIKRREQQDQQIPASTGM